MKENSEQLKEFDAHRFVSYIHNPVTGLEGFIAIHRSNDNSPAFGATRISVYDSRLAALQDALRLSKLMSYKSALAGLRYGGAKGVIIDNRARGLGRKRLLQSYTRKVNYLNGHFFTGADVGISDNDLKVMRAASPFIVGIRSNPAKYTAVGMLYALDVCTQHIFGDADGKGRSFAIQGVGKVGTEFLRLIYKGAGKIYIADIDHDRIRIVKKAFPKVEVVNPRVIFRQRVDVFSPCALGNSLTPQSISKIRAPIILGAANNQLESRAVGELLFKLGILYAPDYVVNAGGLISVVDEYEHKSFDRSRMLRKLETTKKILNSILVQSKVSGRATNIVADEMAEKIFNNR